MPLERPLPSDAALSALRRGLTQVAARSQSASLARARAKLAVRSVTETRRAVRAYRAGLEAIAAGPVHKAARPAGWRFFIPGLSDAQAAHVHRVGRGYELCEWSEGPENRRFVDAIAKLEQSPRCKRRRYQLRCLDVPGLNLTCAWAYRSARDQLFVPVSPMPIDLTTGATFTLRDFLRAVRTFAGQRLMEQSDLLEPLPGSGAGEVETLAEGMANERRHPPDE